jgi:curved DNA-binding protein CbpA
MGSKIDRSIRDYHRACRALAKRYHSERSSTGDADRMAEINAAQDKAM